MSRIARIAALAALVLVAGGAPAEAAPTMKTFADGDFPPADWETVGTGPGGTTSVTRVASGGDPGAFLEVKTTASAEAEMWSYNLYTKEVYDPGVLGGIAQFDYFESSRSRGANQRVAPALRQDGKLFAALEPGVFTLMKVETWQRNEWFGLTADRLRTR